MSVRGIGCSLSLAAVVVACSSGNGGGNASSAQGFIASLCDLLQPCCAKENKTYNQSKCTKFYNDLIAADQTYDAAKGQACLDELRARQNNPEFCSGGGDDAAEDGACGKTFTKAAPTGGTKQPGELCNSERECAPQPDGQVDCSFFSGPEANTRKCQVFVRAKDGEACVGDKRDEDDVVGTVSRDPSPRVGVCWREDGLYCDASTDTCVKLAAEGAACSGFAESSCQDGMRCDTSTRKCVRLLADGADCVPATSFSDPCVATHYCKSDTKKCTRKLGRGAACTGRDECAASEGCIRGKCGFDTGEDASTTLACD